ncbi:hypothetical protein THAOC_16948 [Thalassiosira oceanica]|uniref:4-coumarate-CoA ligase n=1 Tax=Thalassiosira oceanica TaxID=159749 RepID=K0SVZ9_THAOC|nr:hypothetical protein THAOC_16948 [Thalassiosira oceanica]|eukprot:EJK62442.1 hypothetical protein THAOC_16948 [Thalassiosira oceanica]
MFVRAARRSGSRSYATSSPLFDGKVADVCSPFPPISTSYDVPVPEFVSKDWGSPELSSKVAIRDGSTGEVRTFGDYSRHMTNTANALKTEFGLGSEHTAAIYSLNNVDYLPISLAVGQLGAKISPINPLSTVSEMTRILVPSNSKILFTHAKLLPVALEAVKEAPCVEHVVVIPDAEADTKLEGVVQLEDLLAFNSSDERDVGSDHVEHVNKHPWLLPYSSGTTGLPKGVMLTHGNMLANLLQLEAVEKESFPRHESLISPLPFFHIYGLMASLLYCGWQGQTLITTSARFDLANFCALVSEHRPSRAHLVPPIILGLSKHPLVDDYDMTSLEWIVSAAAPLGEEAEKAAEARLGTRVKQAWGMSELSPLGTFNHDADPRGVGPLVSSTEGKVIDPVTGESLGPNESGELCIRGPQVMAGYLNNEEKTNECLSDGGWLRTGDLAHYTDDGYFYITDRIKELIKVRGFPVAPAELEDLLLTNEDVQDSAVVQVPDEASGELPRAYVVLKPTADPAEVTEDVLKDWVKERVSPYKRLHSVKFVEQIPKSASGKILRRLLRDEVKEEFA